jgi:hypothetical protein
MVSDMVFFFRMGFGSKKEFGVSRRLGGGDASDAIASHELDVLRGP